MAVLKQVTGDLAGTLVDLKSDVTVIGRLPECDIILAPNGVSRRHAEIRKVGPAFFVVDLDSRNKTLVNDTELKGGVEHLLKENDRISICGVEFVYHPVEPPKTKDARTRRRPHGGHRERRQRKIRTSAHSKPRARARWPARFVPR